MSVVTTKSTIITNRDAVPTVLTEPSVSNSRVHEAQGFVTAVNGDSIGSIYNFCEVPSNSRISQVLLSCDAITTCAANIGVYKNTKDGGAVISASFFAAAQSLASALSDIDVINQSTNNPIATQELELWKALGLSSDPGTTFDICATLSAAAASGGKIGLKVRFCK